MVIEKVVAGAVLLCSSTKKILLLRRAPNEKMPGIWEFPSGKVNPNESLISCVIREIAEEAGVIISAEDIVSALESFTYGSTVQHNFLVIVDRELAITLSNEHDAYSWEDVSSPKFDETLGPIAKSALSWLLNKTTLIKEVEPYEEHLRTA
jgi:8-oxo-dGTP diphosphatase